MWICVHCGGVASKHLRHTFAHMAASAISRESCHLLPRDTKKRTSLTAVTMYDVAARIVVARSTAPIDSEGGLGTNDWNT